MTVPVHSLPFILHLFISSSLLHRPCHYLYLTFGYHLFAITSEPKHGAQQGEVARLSYLNGHPP
ncbi:hypothetical protein BJX99DRAFT_233195 [Aspergillus californicus]